MGVNEELYHEENRMGANDKAEAAYHGAPEPLSLYSAGSPETLVEAAPEPWTAFGRPGEIPEDLPLNEWVGQALGAASMCWDPRPIGVFDGTRCAHIMDGLMAHINGVIDGVIEGTTKAVEDKGTVHVCGTCEEPFGVGPEAKAAVQAHVEKKHRAKKGKVQVGTDAALREWSELSYEMYALACNSTNGETSKPEEWQAAFVRLRDRFHKALDELPRGYKPAALSTDHTTTAE